MKENKTDTEKDYTLIIYVLSFILITFETTHFEISPSNADV